MHVSVGIVSFRNSDDVVHCLEALSGQTFRAFDVVVCENGGAEAYAALRSRAPATLPGGQSVRLVQAPGNGGFASGVNICLRAAPDADAWWVLNPDTRPDPEALGAMVERLQRGDCEAVGCTLYGPDGLVQSDGGLWRAWLARAVVLGRGRSVSVAADAPDVEARQNFLIGASILLGRSFLAAAGPMREDFFLYVEEVDWCLKARSLGLRLGFAPRARVQHAHGATTGSGQAVSARPRLPIYLDERNKMLLTRDHYPGRIVVAAPAALALIFLRYGRRGAWKQFGYGLSGWWAGLLGERGPPAWLRP
jgi:GT2 family glycosyltransferase